MTGDRLLKIYLNDHLAALTAGVELARRSGSSNADTPLGEFLRELQSDFEDDRAILLDALRSLDLPADPTKRAAGWLAEKFGRLKLNGRLIGYSDLSRVLELEGLSAIAGGNSSLWRSLSATARDRPPLQTFDFDGLAEKSDRLRPRLDEFRSEAVRAAFA